MRGKKTFFSLCYALKNFGSPSSHAFCGICFQERKQFI